jgi:hypothetical protein
VTTKNETKLPSFTQDHGPHFPMSGLRRRQNTLTESDIQDEESKALLTSHHFTIEESPPATPPSSLLLVEDTLLPAALGSPTFDKGYDKPSPGTCSTASSNSTFSTKEYCARLHPTLLQHYYDLINMDRDTSLKGEENKLPLPQLAFQEIELGEIIGRGGFSFVHEIRDVRLQEIYDTGNEEAASRAEFAEKFKNKSVPLEISLGVGGAAASGTAAKSCSPYVLKTLRPDLPEDEHNKGIIDLAVEAQFLTSLSHPHILSLRASSNSDPLEARYFVILDRLVSTLDHKLKVSLCCVFMHISSSAPLNCVIRSIADLA